MSTPSNHHDQNNPTQPKTVFSWAMPLVVILFGLVAFMYFRSPKSENPSTKVEKTTEIKKDTTQKSNK
jgi:cytochrome c-type biogenesis protein CcmH/NrfF